jgi:hypothetical protein
MHRLGSCPVLLLLKPQPSEAYSCTSARRPCGMGGRMRRLAEGSERKALNSASTRSMKTGWGVGVGGSGRAG